MKKVLIYHKRPTPTLGGDCFILLAFTASLQNRCETTLALNFDFGLEKASETFGIPIDLKRVKIVEIEPRGGFLARFECMKPFLRTWALKRLAKNADVCISTNNIFDFGRPAHQFVCILSSLEGKAFYDYVANVKSRTGIKRAVRKMQTFLMENMVKPLLGVRPLKRIIRDPRERIYSTSGYVEKLMRGYFGPFKGEVFYPPTTYAPALRDVPRDPLKVVYIGRIFAPKRIPEMIETVERARKATGANLKFHIAGHLQNDAHSAALKRIAAEKPWVVLEGPKYGEDKEKFLLSGSFAIQAERDETFGICITEYLKSGIVPIVPDEGGPAEIVDNPALTYSTLSEASALLARLVSDSGFLEEQKAFCAKRAGDFTLDAYMRRQDRILDSIISAEAGQ